ncbi:MAG: SAVED domain-containing protein [Prevotellaceae bacterium]|jgi:hypothetical protein|nr:SAVED domain-containing protein [Prevotellaceae bacterium]
MRKLTIPPHIHWLIDNGERLQTSDGKEIKVFEFQHKNDDAILSAWATHFRNQYCADKDIDDLRNGTGLTRKDYLINLKFPSEKHDEKDSSSILGPSIRAGDFAELLISDYLEFLLGYFVPRTRYDHKTIRNESPKASDLIGFKISQLDNFSPDDEMFIFEVKAKFTSPVDGNRLQDAVNGSSKDDLRKAESLNAIKQRYKTEKKRKEKQLIERFQDKVGKPFIEKSGAVAFLEKEVFNKTNFSQTDTSAHTNQNNLFVIAVKGEKMMPLVHELYRRAADEA